MDYGSVSREEMIKAQSYKKERYINDSKNQNGLSDLTESFSVSQTLVCSTFQFLFAISSSRIEYILLFLTDISSKS